MKFGKHIQSVATEWTSYYINYKALKKIIKDKDQPNDTRQTRFFFRLERELEKVNSFYTQKENELLIRLDSLCKKTAASTFLREACIQYQVDLAKLQKFVQINGEGFRKILKKWDKRTKVITKEIYLSRQVEIQPTFHTDVLASLQDKAENYLQELEVKLLRIGEDGENLEVEPYLECPPQVKNYLVMKQHGLLKEWVSKHELPLSRLFLYYCTDTNVECLKVLLESNRVDCNLADDISDHNCLHLLAIEGRLDAIKLCIQYKAKMSLDYFGRSPLHYAAMHGHTDVCLFLYSAGAELNHIDQDGNSPLIYTITSGHISTLQCLIDLGADFEPSRASRAPVTLACQYGRLEILQNLLSRGVKILPDMDGLFPLHLACRAGRIDIIRCLIEHGSSDVETRDAFTGWTPIFFAASEGHLDCIRLLLDAGARVDHVDDSGWLAWTYALYKGHLEGAEMLEPPVQPSANVHLNMEPIGSGAVEQFESVRSMELNVERVQKEEEEGEWKATRTGGGVHMGMEELDMDDIPSLSLPPPIIPLRIYGHHYLDKNYLVQIHLEQLDGTSPVRLAGARTLYSLKLKTTFNTEKDHAFFANLPLKDDVTMFSYTTPNIANLSLEFDLYPAFGTTAIGRACLPSAQFHSMIAQSPDGVSSHPCTVAFFDTHQKVMGDISFKFLLIRPFIHPSLQIGGRIETYWKSTTVVSNPTAGQDTVHSLVTGSSLVEEYIELVVQSTSDGVIVVYPERTISLGGIDIPLHLLSYKEATHAFTAAKLLETSSIHGGNQHSRAISAGVDAAIEVYTEFTTLEYALENVPSAFGISIIMQRYTESGSISINHFVDATLQVCYDHSNSRSLIFSSFHATLCSTLNWKQPNYGVFFRTFCGRKNEWQPVPMSIKESIKFAKSCDLIGIICESKPLVQMPVLIQTIKDSGLMLASFGESNAMEANVKLQEGEGADATICGWIFKYKQQ